VVKAYVELLNYVISIIPILIEAPISLSSAKKQGKFVSKDMPFTGPEYETGILSGFFSHF
jgi:hypothetical protein